MKMFFVERNYMIYRYLRLISFEIIIIVIIIIIIYINTNFIKKLT